MAVPSRNGRHPGQTGRTVRLPVQVVAPGDDGAIRLEGEAVVAPCRDGLDVRQTGRNVCLAVGVVAPGDDCAIALEGEAEVPTGRNGRHPRQTGGNVRLGVDVGAPGDHSAVAPDGKAVVCPRRHCRHPGQVGRNARLPVAVVAPGENRTVRLERQPVEVARRDGAEMIPADRGVRLAFVVSAPGQEVVPRWRDRREGVHAVRRAETRGSVIANLRRAQIRSVAAPVLAADVACGHVVEVGGVRIQVPRGIRPSHRHPCQGINPGDDRSGGARSASDSPPTRVGVHRDPGVRIRNGRDIGGGLPAAPRIGLPQRLRLYRGATGTGGVVAGAVGVIPHRFGPAASIRGRFEGCPTNRRHVRRGRREQRQVERDLVVARAPISCGGDDRHPRVIQVGIRFNSVEEALHRTVAQRHHRCAEQDRRVNSVHDIRELRGVGLDMKDLAVRADRGNHLEVQVGLSGPARVVYRIGRPTDLVDLPEAAVGRGAWRQSEVTAIHGQIGFPSRRVVRIDHRNDDPGATGARQRIGAPQIGRTVARHHGGGCDLTGGKTWDVRPADRQTAHVAHWNRAAEGLRTTGFGATGGCGCRGCATGVRGGLGRDRG